jgi:hypothetical protein
MPWYQAMGRSITQRTPQTRALLGTAAGDARLDVLGPDQAAVLVVVVAAVGEHLLSADI